MRNIITIIQKYKHIILYIIFGVVTTGVNFGTYSILVKLCEIDILLSNIIAWFISVLVAYITNKIWVFRSSSGQFKGIIRELSLFYAARLTSGVFEIIMFPILLNIGLNQVWFGVEGLAAKVAISIVVVIANYFFSKYAIFKEKREYYAE
jgi:putative flippase GtrA